MGFFALKEEKKSLLLVIVLLFPLDCLTSHIFCSVLLNILLRLVVSSKWLYAVWLLKLPLVILNFQQYRHYFALIEENGIFSSNIPNHTNEKLKANKFSSAVIKNT